jgi:hypothetical protein
MGEERRDCETRAVSSKTLSSCHWLESLWGTHFTTTFVSIAFSLRLALEATHVLPVGSPDDDRTYDVYEEC